MAAKMTTVLCSCSWAGELPDSAACPACKRDATNRVTKIRLAPLLAIAGGTLTTLEPIVRIWLRDHGLIKREGDPTPPTPDGKQHSKRTKLPLVLTPGGQRVVDAHRAAAYELLSQSEPDIRDEMP